MQTAAIIALALLALLTMAGQVAIAIYAIRSSRTVLRDQADRLMAKSYEEYAVRSAPPAPPPPEEAPPPPFVDPGEAAMIRAGYKPGADNAKWNALFSGIDRQFVEGFGAPPAPPATPALDPEGKQ